MRKIIRFSVFLCLIFCLAIIVSGCSTKDEVPNESNKQVTIDDVNYTSLTEAVDNAKDGDTIKIYNDLKDNKNVIISKPLTIKGIATSSQNKPRFYGSITIDLSGEEDSASIENIEIIHQGTLEEGQNNDTRTGINLIDGGLNLKSNVIGLDESSTTQDSAAGLIISRRFGSKNLMPIIIKGNRFNSYEVNNSNSSAMIIKSDKEGEYQKLNLNENEIYNQNNFNSNKESNQFMSIDYSSTPFTYSFLCTSSADKLMSALKENQNNNGSVFYYYAVQPLNTSYEEPITVNNKTTLTINGSSAADFNNSFLIVDGTINVNTNLSNLVIQRGSSTSSIIFDQNTEKSNVEIK